MRRNKQSKTHRAKSEHARRRKARVSEDGRDGGSGLVRETLIPLLAALAIIVPLRAAVADWNDIPSGSMRPTLLEGDRIFVNKLAYGLRVPLTKVWLTRWEEPRRGDVVTFASPADGIRLVKRIVGLPGDRIAMNGNRLTINGRELVYENLSAASQDFRPAFHPQARQLRTEYLGDGSHSVTLTPALAGRTDSFPEFTVPDGRYFFLGDNRDRSHDSRFIGSVELDEIDGRVSYIALSVDPEHDYRPRFERWFKPLDSNVD